MVQCRGMKIPSHIPAWSSNNFRENLYARPHCGRNNVEFADVLFCIQLCLVWLFILFGFVGGGGFLFVLVFDFTSAVS